MAFPTGWDRKCIITIPDAQISGSNTDFPVLLTHDNFPTEMMDGGANSALNGGGDVRFSLDSAGTTQLPCEIVSFITGGTPSAEIHTKLPTLNTGADLTLYVWYKKAGEVQPAVTDPFGRNAVWADYEAAYHLNGADGTDASGNHNGTPQNAPATEAGPWGTAISLNGSNQYVSLPASLENALAGIGGFTVTSWASPDNVTSDRVIFENIVGGGAGIKIWADAGGTGDGWAAAISNVGGTIVVGANNSDATLNTWQRVTCRYTGARLEIIKNNNTPSFVSKTGNTVDPNKNIEIGRGGSTSSNYFIGGLKEIRVSLAALSDDWLTTEYNNQSDPAAFGIAGTPEDAGGGTLSIQKISHNISSDALIPMQMHNLNVAPANHNITSLSAAITFGLTVAPDYGAHVSVSDGVILFQNQILVISDGLQPCASESLSLTQIHDLSIWNNGLAVSSDDAIFLQFQTMIMQNSVHLLSADITPLFDPASFAPSPRRMQEARRGNRSFSNAGKLRTIDAINHLTKRI
ncbi:MAG: hypothetical protein L3J58_07765 [Emcibacter sp.]|nr:hypothetical protein [Emcibacter sp.]